MIENIPYTYLIINKTTKLAYYGVQYSKTANPKNLWVNYFTSSKIIKKLILEYGKDDFITEIRKTFNTPEAAIKWELKVLQRLAVKSDNFVNQRANSSKPYKGKCICINNGIKEMHFPIKCKIPKNWKKGRLTAPTKDLLHYYDPISLQVYYFKKTETIPENLIKGHPKRTEYYNPKTHKTISLLKTDLIPDNFIKGRGYEQPTKNKTTIYNKITLEIKYINKNDEIPEGWIKGNCKSIGMKNKMVIYNEITLEIKYINKNDKIDKGWLKGDIRKMNKPSFNSNKIAIYNETTLKIKYIDKNDKIPEGWIKGGPKNKNTWIKDRIWIHNNKLQKTKMVNKDDELPEGWIKGRRLTKQFN